MDDDEGVEEEEQTNDVYRDGRVHVLAEKCGTCIFGPNRFVPGSRVRGMVKDTEHTDGSTIPCHSTLYRDDVHNAICRGWWDRYGDKDWIVRLAQAQGIVEEDPVPPKLEAR